MGYTGFSWVDMGLNEFLWVLLGWSVFNWVSSGLLPCFKVDWGVCGIRRVWPVSRAPTQRRAPVAPFSVRFCFAFVSLLFVSLLVVLFVFFRCRRLRRLFPPVSPSLLFVSFARDSWFCFVVFILFRFLAFFLSSGRRRRVPPWRARHWLKVNAGRTHLRAQNAAVKQTPIEGCRIRSNVSTTPLKDSRRTDSGADVCEDSIGRHLRRESRGFCSETK